MTFIPFADRVRETSTTTGTGTLNLAGALSSDFKTFVSGIGSGNSCYYAIVNNGLGEWEIGVGTVTSGSPATLSRDTVLSNSLGTTAKISFSAGTKDVFVDIPAGFFIGSQSCRVYNNANIAITNQTETALTFNSERSDTNGLHSTSSNTGRLTAQVAGTYCIAVSVVFASNAVGVRYVYIRLNGGSAIAINRLPVCGSGGLDDWMAFSTIYPLAAGDYVDCVVYQNSGLSLNVLTVNNYSPEFSMTRTGD